MSDERQNGGVGRAARAWLDAGFAALVEEGAQGLTIERLCRRTGKTRGSFYHHFTDHDAFVRALVEYWQTRQTEEVIAQTEAETVGARRDAVLHEAVQGLDHALDVAMRRLGVENAVVGAVVTQVDMQRVAFLEAMHRAGGAQNPEDASVLARMEYALLVGWQMLWPEGKMPAHDRFGALLRALGGR